MEGHFSYLLFGSAHREEGAWNESLNVGAIGEERNPTPE